MCEKKGYKQIKPDDMAFNLEWAVKYSLVDKKVKFDPPTRKKKVRYSKQLFLTSMILFYDIRPNINVIRNV